jgi:signal transduction histidine kinase
LPNKWEKVAAKIPLLPVDEEDVVDPATGAQLEQRLIREMAHGLRFGWAMYVIFAAVFCYQDGLASSDPWAGPIFVVLVLMAGVWRTGCLIRVLRFPDVIESAWRDRFLHSVWLHSIVWGCFLWWAFVESRGNLVLESAVMVGVAGFASAGASAHAAHPPAAWLHLSVQCAPATIWAFHERGRIGGTMVFLVPAFFAFCAFLIKVQHRHTFNLHRTQILMEKRGEELGRAREIAEEASSARARFLANMSHEIRTPLNGVLGLTQALADTSLDNEQRELLDALEHSGQHLLELVNDVLDLSKVNAGKMALECVAFDLASIIHDLAAATRTLTEGKSLRFVVEYPDELRRSFHGDPLRIRQILSNLLNNAVKFTAAGEIRLAVERGRPGWIHFAVTDTGIGISPENSRELFQDFVQADRSTTRRFGGTGLGLAISKRLADLMGGVLSVESTTGQGSRFCFDVPLAACDSPKPAAAAADAEPPLPGFPGALRILVAEDNRVNQTVMRRLLAGCGASIEVAENGRIAVERHAAMPYDLILMDCHMPEMDGFEATGAIRALPDERARVPIIAVTASALAEDRKRCVEAGMDGHLAKPIRREELLQRVAEFCAAAV